MNLTKAVKTIRLKPDGTNWALSAAASDANSEVVDTLGFQGVRFMAGFGAITAGAATSIKVQQGTATNVSDAADLEDTGITVADSDDNKVAIVEVNRPRERYVRCVIKRATQNSVVDFLVAELFNPRELPITNDGTTVGNEVHDGSAEGTA